MLTSKQYVDALRYALNHLYEPNVQRTSPLVDILGLAGRSNLGLALQEALIKAIESLGREPESGGSSPVRRAYQILLFRYVQQCSQQEVADQLGVSPRHLRREQQTALEILAQRLSREYAVRLPPGPSRASEDSPEDQAKARPDIGNELAWLETATPAQPIALDDPLASALDLARPMAREHNVTILLDDRRKLPLVVVHPVALRQILLTLLGLGIRHAQKGRVTISAHAAGWGVRITVRALDAVPDGLSLDEEASVEVLRHLVSTSRGRMELAQSTQSFFATVILPAREEVPILIIDDNTDTLALVQRYLSGTRYRFLAAQTFSQALSVAQDDPPKVIILDVMMPEMDGWELMGRLQQHPVTQGVPIIIFSILSEEELAISLGATGFIRKPVSREAFLRILDSQLTL